MELSPIGIINTNTIIHYPSRRVTRVINATQDKAPMTVLEDKLVDQISSSLNRLPAGIPSHIIKKRSGGFAAALVHEVRNPLTNINLSAEILGSDDLSEDQNKFLDIIKRGVVRINNLLADFLISNKDDIVHSELCSMNGLLDEVLAVNSDRMRLKNILLIKNYSFRDWKILVNKEEIKIALINIILNAIEAMPVGNGILKLRTGIIQDKCFIEIEDNGIGISEKNLENIFDPYYSNKPGGMGLGLSTTMDILLANCGTLNVKSEEGSGTHFTLCFNKMEHE
jgi:signal transduction histidine kinase